MIIGERLKGILKNKAISAKEFAMKVNVTEGMVYKYYKMSNIDSSLVYKWSECLDLPIMTFLDDEYYNKVICGEVRPCFDKIDDIEDDRGISCHVEKSNLQPILDIRVCAGSGIGLDGSENKVTEWVSIPKFEGCLGVTVFGDSMYDKFKSGDVVFVRPISGRNDIDFGQCYVVITREDRYIKNLYESERGDDYVSMVSYNIETNPDGRRKYPDRNIKKEEILFLYKVAGKLRRSQL